MRKYLDKCATIDKNPQDNAREFLQSRGDENRINLMHQANKEGKQFTTPMKLRRIKVSARVEDIANFVDQPLTSDDYKDSEVKSSNKRA